MKAKRRSATGANLILMLAGGRLVRSRALAVWVLVTVFLAGVLGLALYATLDLVEILLFSLRYAYSYGSRLWWPSSPFDGTDERHGEVYLSAVVLSALLILTIVHTLPHGALAVVRERERRTLESLLLTRLRASYILWGKLVGVMLTPALASLAVLPVMALSFSMGRISVVTILAAAGFLLISQLFFAAIALCVSCWCRRSVPALVLSYLAFLLVCGAPLLGWAPPGPTVPDFSWWRDALTALSPPAALSQWLLASRTAAIPMPPIPLAALAAAEYAVFTLLSFALGTLGLRSRR